MLFSSQRPPHVTNSPPPDSYSVSTVRATTFSISQNRVAMRFLCGHYLALSAKPRKGFVGLVQRGVSLTEIAQSAAVEAASICCHALGACPEIRMSVDRAGDGLVAAVPEYVHYVVLELLKNAMRATMQTHGGGNRGGGSTGAASTEMDVAGEEDARVKQRAGRGDADDDDAGRRRALIVFADVPAVNISVKTYGAEDVMLVVADKGGGIPTDATDKVRRDTLQVAHRTVGMFL